MCCSLQPKNLTFLLKTLLLSILVHFTHDPTLLIFMKSFFSMFRRFQRLVFHLELEKCVSVLYFVRQWDPYGKVLQGNEPRLCGLSYVVLEP